MQDLWSDDRHGLVTDRLTSQCYPCVHIYARRQVNHNQSSEDRSGRYCQYENQRESWSHHENAHAEAEDRGTSIQAYRICQGLAAQKRCWQRTPGCARVWRIRRSLLIFQVCQYWRNRESLCWTEEQLMSGWLSISGDIHELRSIWRAEIESRDSSHNTAASLSESVEVEDDFWSVKSEMAATKSTVARERRGAGRARVHVRVATIASDRRRRERSAGSYVNEAQSGKKVSYLNKWLISVKNYNFLFS